MTDFTYREIKNTAKPRNGKVLDGVQMTSTAGSSSGGAVGELYWKLVTTDSSGAALAQPYILTTYPAVSERELTSWGLGNNSLAGIALSNLVDVDVSTLADGQALVWDATNSKWVASDYSGGGTDVVYDGTQNGLVPFVSGKNTTSYFLNGAGGWTVPYTHPTLSSYSNGLYKVTINSTGHVSSATTVTSSDIMSLHTSRSSASSGLYKIAIDSYGHITSYSTADIMSLHTSRTSLSLGLYKIGTDSYGHVTSSGSVSSSDLVSIINTFTLTTNGLVPAPGGSYTSNAEMYLNGAGDWQHVSLVQSTQNNTYLFQDYYAPGWSSGFIPVVKSDGVMEVGQCIDLHASSSSGTDYSQRFESNSSYLKLYGTLAVTGDVTAYSSSDRRLKDDIKRIHTGLDTILKLNPVTFRWNIEGLKTHPFQDSESMSAGFIAQDLQNILPFAVQERDNGMLAIDEKMIVPYLVDAVQHLCYVISKMGGTL